MSSSRKKTPGVSYRNPEFKALFNRALRGKLKNPDFQIADGKAFRKEYSTYSICDWKRLIWSEEDYKWASGKEHQYKFK